MRLIIFLSIFNIVLFIPYIRVIADSYERWRANSSDYLPDCGNDIHFYHSDNPVTIQGFAKDISKRLDFMLKSLS